MNKSLYFRNFIITAALVLVSFLIIGMVFVFLARGFVISEKKDSLRSVGTEVVHVASAFEREGELSDWALRMHLSSVAHITGNQIFITDSTGCVVSCSDMDIVCSHLGRYVDLSILDHVDQNGGYEQISTLGGLLKSTYYIVAMPIQGSDGSTIGYVFTGSDSTRVVAAWYAFMLLYLIVALCIMLIAMVISFFASKYEAKPLNDMAAAAHRFAHGDFAVRVEDEGREDEIGELTRAFNSMADSLEQAETRRSEFIANVSHELKTPMTSIAGFADGILDGTIPPEDQRRYLATISSETKRLSRLVRSMLDLSKLQTKDVRELREQSFDINELLLRTLLNFETKINERKLDVDVQLPEDSIVVCGDSDAITRVVYNLLDNAVKFAREGSTITLGLWKTGQKAFVSVKDEGETIPPQELALIFDRFHKTDRSRSLDRDGVGLGLYLVKTILNNHDEDITVTSENGVTEFVFTLTLKM